MKTETSNSRRNALKTLGAFGASSAMLSLTVTDVFGQTSIPIALTTGLKLANYGPIYVAARNGLFAKQGLAVTVNVGGTVVEPVSIALSGRGPFAVTGTGMAVNSTLEGGQMKVVAKMCGALGMWVVTRPGTTFTSLADFKGKKVASLRYPSNTVTSPTFAMKKFAGMDPKASGVEFIEGPPGSIVGAVRDKRADVGVAMGIKGTEAAKEAAQMVLADDNFATITHAIEEGRVVYDNLKKSILFILPTNGGQSMTLLAAIALGMTLPITPLQILWVNMISAVTLALALAFEPAEDDLMRRPARDPAAPLLSAQLLWRVLFIAVLMTLASVGLFHLTQQQGWSLEASRTLAVNAIIACEVGYLFSSRRLEGPACFGWRDNPMIWSMVLLIVALQLLFSYAPALQGLFATSALPLAAWGLCLLLAAAVCALVELEKYLLRRFKAR